MSFLHKIDTLHKIYQSDYGIDASNDTFSSFINVEPVNISLTKQFIVRKQAKSKLLIVSGNQRVHLSDYQIIKTILQMDKCYIEWFLLNFIKLYNDEFVSFKFKVEDDLFEGIGIDYYPSSCDILLFSDTIIDINDLIFILNFIFSKDHQWEIDKPQKDFSKRTIVKYITLIDYYANNSERSKDYLYSIGYPVNNREFIDVPKTAKMFSNVSSFDISRFM